MNKTLWLILFAALAFVSCSDDDGIDDKYKNMKAELVELHTSMATRVNYAINDNDETLTFNPHMQVSWAERPDTLYRALLYYNNVGNSTDVQPVELAPVTVLWPKPIEKIDKMITDPVSFESAWMAQNGRYINLLVKIKTGDNGEGGQRQRIGIATNEVKEDDSGHKTYVYTLYHAQNGVPEYYSTNVYLSIPVAGINTGDKIVVNINDYKEMVTKEFIK